MGGTTPGFRLFGALQDDLDARSRGGGNDPASLSYLYLYGAWALGWTSYDFLPFNSVHYHEYTSVGAPALNYTILVRGT